MGKLRNIITFLILLLIMVCPAAEAFEYSNEIEKLISFGICEESDLAEGNMLRGDFIRMAVKASGTQAEMYSSVLPPFSDIDESDKNYTYINTAYNIGLIGGTSDGRACPNDEINAKQASKILVTMLGYAQKAEVKGGYPDGYLILGRDIGLYKNAAIGSFDASLSKESACKMLSNALEASFAEISAVGKYAAYTQSKQMYMSKMLDIYKISGVLEQNGYTSIYGTSEIDNDMIEINGLRLKCDSKTGTELLGYYVDCYFKGTDGIDKAIHIEVKENKNNAVTVLSREINPEGTTLSSVSYTHDNKINKLKLSDTVSLIKNGVKIQTDVAKLCPQNGEVTFIDNDNDNLYDVARIYEYRTVVVHAVAEATGSVVDSLGGSTLDLSQKTDFDVSILLDGKEISVSELLENDVVFYYEIAAKKPLKMLLVSRNCVNGEILAEDEEKLTFAENEYYASSSMLSKLVPGDSGSFYLDLYETIVYAKTAESDWATGILTAIGKGSLDRVSVKIFTENDRWVTLDLRKQILLNGERKNATYFYDKCAQQGGDIRKLLMYKVDENAVITSICEPVDCVAEPDKTELAIENDDFRLSKKLSNTYYRNFLASFDNNVCLSPDAKIFFVPSDASADETQYYMGSKSMLIHNKSYSLVYAYNANETRMTDLLVVYSDGVSVNNTDNVADFFLVEKVAYATVNDETLPCLQGKYGAYGDVQVYMSADSVLDEVGGVKKGDILQFGFDNEGMAAKINKVFTLSDTFEKELISNSLYSVSTLLSGRVIKTDPASMRIIVDYGEEEGALLGMDSYLKVVYIYDISDNEIITGTAYDILEGDFIVGGFRYYQSQAMIIYRD